MSELTKLSNSLEQTLKDSDLQIDKCDDHEKSQIIARLFSAFLLGTMSYEEFLRASHIVNQLIIDDLKWFIDNGWEKIESTEENINT